jgi:hypothetical protein
MADLPDYQHIEEAYRGVTEVIGKLPESIEARRATDHLKLAEGYTYQARERAKADRTEPVQPELPDASISTRGPAMLGWPFSTRMSSWRWTDTGTAP